MATLTNNPPRNKGMHIGLWGVQLLLAVAFMMAGAMKLMTAPEALVQNGMAWVAAVPPGLVKFIGLAEVLGAIGLILPAAMRIMPQLTGWAGVGLATVMAGAVITHASRGEFGMIPVNLVLGGLAAFVAWGRLKKAPIDPRV